MSAHIVKVVFGETAVGKHCDGEPDSEVEEWGSIETFTFDTEAEANAFQKGLAAASGWMEFCIYDADYLATEEVEDE